MPSIVCCRCHLGPAFPFEAVRDAPGGESVYCIPCLKAIAPFDPILEDNGEPNIFPGCCGMCCEAVPPNYANRPFEESGLLRICSECTSLLRNPDPHDAPIDVVCTTQLRVEP